MMNIAIFGLQKKFILNNKMEDHMKNGQSKFVELWKNYVTYLEKFEDKYYYVTKNFKGEVIDAEEVNKENASIIYSGVN